MKSMLFSLSRSKQDGLVSAGRPILISLTFFLIVLVPRSLDALVLRLDGLPDPFILSTVISFFLLLGYLRALRKPIHSIGLHTRNFDKAFLIGALSLLSVYATLYAFQFYRLSLAGESPRLVFAAIDHRTETMAGLYFTLFILTRQFINAFMEEFIFRGVILPHLMLRFRFWKANVLQALLFGLAHLVVPLQSWLSGKATTGEAAAEAVFLLVSATVGGLIFGYLYYRTDTLWTAIFAHLIDNVIALSFHIQTPTRLNAETDILMLASIGFISLAILAWAVSKRSNLPTLKPWQST